ncbi:MAG: SDR family oxidoreductase [Desulfatibacillum sp.]|nr:SDR family oxidoreductase [Desulfatibacillum sp.]
MKDLHGKQAYITGGSSGIGLETARQLAAKGCHITLFARDSQKLEKARQLILNFRKAQAQKVEIFPMDVTNPQGVEDAIKAAVEAAGPPDIVIANAGQGHGDYFENTTYAIFDRVLQTNVYGVRNVVASSLPYLQEKQGHVVIVASLGGMAAMPGYTAYGTSKFAAVGFAKCLRPELKTKGIGLTLVCPPEVPTPMVDEEIQTLPKEFRAVKLMAGIQSVEQVSRTIVRGIEKNRFVVIPGFLAKASYALVKFLPGLLSNWVTDLMVRQHSKS